jgi:hypothetical protein
MSCVCGWDWACCWDWDCGWVESYMSTSTMPQELTRTLFVVHP